MFRKIVWILIAANLCLALETPAWAADNTGSICVIPYWAGSRIAGGQVALCRIGDLTPEKCHITDGLAEWVIDRQEVETDAFLQWALKQTWEEKVCNISDERGARFENLKEGLYLVVQTVPASGFAAFQPFIVTLTAQAERNITVNPEVTALTEIPKTGDYPAPIFMAMFLSFAVALIMILAENRRK